MLRNVSLRTKALVVVAAPFAVTAALMVTLYRQGEAIAAAEAWSQHSQEVLAKIELAEFGLVDIQAEILQLALLGTGSSPLEPASRNMVVGEALDALQELTFDDHVQKVRIAKLVPLAKQLLSDMDTAINAYRLGSTDVRRQVAANERQLNEMLERMREVKRTESELSAQRLARVAELGRLRQNTLIAGGIATLAIALLVGAFLARSVLQRLQVVHDNVERLSTDRDLLPPIRGRDEIGQIDRAFHDMVRTLRAQQKDNDMFVYSVSHDLRSPLVNLQGFGKELRFALGTLNELLSRPEVPETIRAEALRIAHHDMAEAMDFIDTAVQRQAGIIDSLLRLSRAGRVEYHWQEVDVARCIESIVASLRRRPGLAAVEFVVGDLPRAWGDPNAIERVFDNLLGNAVKYLDPGRPGRIDVGATVDAAQAVTYFVRDNGIGIATEQIERVFMPFTRLGAGEGEGIGLSLVRRAVERHYGKVWLESRPGEGTTVYLTLRAV